MRSFIVASFAMAASAQTAGYYAIHAPSTSEEVPACAPYTITWGGAVADVLAGPVTFQLIGGATQQTLVDVGGAFGSVDGSVGSFSWDVPCDAGAAAIYGIKIANAADPSVFQYSQPFAIAAADVDPTTTSDVEPTLEPTTVEPEPTTTEEPTTTDPEPTTTDPEPTTTDPEPTTTDPESTTTADPEPTTTPETTPITTITPVSNTTTFASITITSTTDVTAEPTSEVTDIPTTAGASTMATGSFAIFAGVIAFFVL